MTYTVLERIFAFVDSIGASAEAKAGSILVSVDDELAVSQPSLI